MAPFPYWRPVNSGGPWRDSSIEAPPNPPTVVEWVESRKSSNVEAEPYWVGPDDADTFTAEHPPRTEVPAGGGTASGPLPGARIPGSRVPSRSVAR